MRILHADLRRHAAYARDAARLEAHERALAASIQPGDHVLDISEGTGALGVLALRHGAGHVTHADAGPLLEVARLVHRRAGTQDRATFVRAPSTQVTLPRPAHVVVGDPVGAWGFHPGVLARFTDAAQRHLAPGGRLVPSRVDLHVAPAQVGSLQHELSAWRSRPAGVDLGEVSALLAGMTDMEATPGEVQWLGESQPLLSLDLATAGGTYHVGSTGLHVTTAGRLDALACSFVGHLAPGVSITSNPRAPHAIRESLGLLPLADAPLLQAGSTLAMELRIDGRSDFRVWRVHNAGAAGFTREHSTAESLLLTVDTLRRNHRP